MDVTKATKYVLKLAVLTLISGKPASRNKKTLVLLQGCQMFLNTIYQNGGKYTKLPINLLNGH
jgi:hypothetical protein